MTNEKTGGRHAALNKGVFSVAGYIHTGLVSEDEITREFTAAGRACQLPEDEIAETIADGIEAGKKEPREVPSDRSGVEASEQAGVVNAEDEPPLRDFDELDMFVTAPGSDPDAAPQEQPTADDPLRGLEHLAGVALLGRDRILELASKPVDYIWKNIVVAGTIVLVAGPPADGKTTFLFLVLAGRANLEAPIVLLGHGLQPAPPGQFVIIIEGEHSEASTSRKIVGSVRLLGVDDLALDRVIIVARKAVRLGSPEWDDVVRMVRAGLVSDIAIDTVARVAPADADSEREQVAVFDGVAQAIEQAPEGAPKPTVWAVAHTRKNNTSGDLGDVSGSVQRVGQSDTVLLLKAERVDGRVVSTRVTFAKLREDPDEWPEPAELTISRGADGKQVLSVQGSPSAVQQDDRPLEARVMDQLEVGPKTKTALAEKLKRSRQDIDEALTNLFTARAIVTAEITVGGRQRKAFAVRPGAPDGAPDSMITGLGTG